MEHRSYSQREVWLFAYSLGLTCFLLFFPETREFSTLPPFLAWLMVNRRAT